MCSIEVYNIPLLSTQRFSFFFWCCKTTSFVIKGISSILVRKQQWTFSVTREDPPTSPTKQNQFSLWQWQSIKIMDWIIFYCRIAMWWKVGILSLTKKHQSILFVSVLSHTHKHSLSLSLSLSHCLWVSLCSHTHTPLPPFTPSTLWYIL